MYLNISFLLHWMMSFLHWISGTFAGEVILHLQIVRCDIVFSLAA